MATILSCDISTSMAGFSVLENGKLIFNESLKLSKSKPIDLIDKALILKTFLETIKEKFKIEHIVLEDSLMKFGFGRSSASVLGLLNKFNGIAWWTLYQVFGIKPVLLGPLQSRKILGILIAKGDDTKLAIVKYVMKSEPTFEVKMTPGGNFVPGCDDRADSVVLGRALEKILEFPELLVPKPKKARRSKKR